MRRTPGRGDWHLRLLRPGVCVPGAPNLPKRRAWFVPMSVRRRFPAMTRPCNCCSKKVCKTPRPARFTAISAAHCRWAPPSALTLFCPCRFWFISRRPVASFLSCRESGTAGQRKNKLPILMSSTYHQLLDATIQHLEDLKSRGVRHVAVSPETLRALAQPRRRNLKSRKVCRESERRHRPGANGMPETRRVGDRRSSACHRTGNLLALPGETVPSQRRRWIRRQRPPRLPPCANGRWPV